MWRSVLLHDFPNEDIRSFRALSGSLAFNALTLNPRVGAVQITPGRGFQYTLAKPLEDIIGVSGRVRLRYPIQGVTNPVPILRAGDMAEFRIRPSTIEVELSTQQQELDAPAQTLLRIGTAEVQLGSIRLPHRRFVDLRFDWHTSGQTRLHIDGRLVGYHNALSAGARLTVADVTFGLPSEDITQTNPRYEVGKVFVRTLARSDSLAVLSRELPTIRLPDDDLLERCRMRTTVNLLAMLDRLRQFMAEIHQTLSQPWSEANGPAAGPFASDATLAHDLATKAVTALWEMLRSGDYSATHTFLDPFTSFLRILHRAQPKTFEQLAAELAIASAVPSDCRAILDKALARDWRGFAALNALLVAASERVTAIAGGN